MSQHRQPLSYSNAEHPQADSKQWKRKETSFPNQNTDRKRKKLSPSSFWPASPPRYGRCVAQRLRPRNSFARAIPSHLVHDESPTTGNSRVYVASMQRPQGSRSSWAWPWASWALRPSLLWVLQPSCSGRRQLSSRVLLLCVQRLSWWRSSSP